MGPSRKPEQSASRLSLHLVRLRVGTQSLLFLALILSILALVLSISESRRCLTPKKVQSAKVLLKYFQLSEHWASGIRHFGVSAHARYRAPSYISSPLLYW